MTELETFRKLDELISKADNVAEVHSLGTIEARKQKFDITGFVFGPEDKSVPTFGLFGGVHGLEKIGSHLVIHFLQHLLKLLTWDETIQELLTKVRIVAIPIVNPGGVYMVRRSNPSGVDLMRNAPTPTADKKHFLVSGHKYSSKIPWFQGEEIQTETQAVMDFVREQMFQSQFSMSLDIHSGFGARDRLWYPYARTTDPIPDVSTAKAFKQHMRDHLAYHVYKVRTQSKDYIIEGDLWDHIYDEHLKSRENNVYIPWTLELGSWLWVKKNPLQLLKAKGLFNPTVDYRYYRVMRRHERLFHFYIKSILNYKLWNQDLIY